jgi:hypothetical protein
MAVITTMPTDIQERLSVAYLTAVAANAGCQLSTCALDRNGIDATICPIAGARIGIDVQMKATTQNIRIEGGTLLSFQLDTPTYDKLRRIDCMNPQLLVVYEMPIDHNLWLNVNHPNTTLQHLAYYLDLGGAPAVATATTAVHIPAANVFDHRAISGLMVALYDKLASGKSWWAA